MRYVEAFQQLEVFFAKALASMMLLLISMYLITMLSCEWE